jgi:CO/xanthine dehydrogenase Mo-binding subunit
MRDLRQVGRPVSRLDGREKVSGAAIFLSDMTVKNMAHGVAVRSPFPRARVISIDASDALALEGVWAVVTPTDVSDLPPLRIFGDSPPVQHVITNRPNFVGDVVAAVAASTPEIARHAATLVDVRYEELPACLTFEQALGGDFQLHEAAPDNRAGPEIQIARGEPDALIDTCDHVFRDTYFTQRQAAQTIESLVCLCDWSSGDELHVWTHLDSMFHFRDALAEALALEPASVVIHPPPHLGATFGLKNSLIAGLEPLAAVLSKKAGRPIKMALSPEESIGATVTRHPARIELATGLDKMGNIVARTADIVLDSGAYGWGYVVALSMLGKWATLYRCEHIRFTATSVYTNHVPGGAYRSVGTAQIHFAMESQIDEIARTLAIDPVEFRRRTLVRAGDTLPMGTEIRSLGVDECLDQGAAAFGWTGTTNPEYSKFGVTRGVGMAVGMHHAGLTGLIPTPEGSKCTVEVTTDNRYVVTVGVVEKGQGSLTTLALIAAEELGVDPDLISIVNAGTNGVPLDYSGAEASRTTYVTGRAVMNACQNLKVAIQDAGGPEAIEGQPIEGSFVPADKDPLPVIGAHFCEVEVDHATGVVSVVRYVAAQDVGRVINLLGCRGQIEGGIHHGLGYALCEELLYDEGQPINPNFMGYKVLMSTDMPEITAVLVEAPDPDGGPYGAKGIGTPVIPAIAPAVANAIRDAIGQRLRSLPMTPPRVLAAITSA